MQRTDEALDPMTVIAALGTIAIGSGLAAGAVRTLRTIQRFLKLGKKGEAERTLEQVKGRERAMIDAYIERERRKVSPARESVIDWSRPVPTARRNRAWVVRNHADVVSFSIGEGVCIAMLRPVRDTAHGVTLVLSESEAKALVAQPVFHGVPVNFQGETHHVGGTGPFSYVGLAERAALAMQAGPLDEADEVDSLEALIAAGRAQREPSGVVYVRPASWDASKSAGAPEGARFRGGDLKHVQAWATKAQAVAGAKAVGWPAKSVSPVHTRLGGVAYALVDGRVGYVAKVSYEAMRSGRSFERETEESLDEDVVTIRVTRAQYDASIPWSIADRKAMKKIRRVETVGGFAYKPENDEQKATVRRVLRLDANEAAPNYLRQALGLEPMAPPKKHECPRCHEHNAYWHEAHPDTGMDEMVLRCPDCGHDTVAESLDEVEVTVAKGSEATYARWQKEAALQRERRQLKRKLRREEKKSGKKSGRVSGHWRTTSTGHRIFIENGKVTKGNPHVLKAIHGKKHESEDDDRQTAQFHRKLLRARNTKALQHLGYTPEEVDRMTAWMRSGMSKEDALYALGKRRATVGATAEGFDEAREGAYVVWMRAKPHGQMVIGVYQDRSVANQARVANEGSHVTFVSGVTGVDSIRAWTKLRDAQIQTYYKKLGANPFGIADFSLGDSGDEADEGLDEVSPPGFEGTVRAMKKHREIDNPYALSWWLKNRGAKSHRKADGTKKKHEDVLGEGLSAGGGRDAAVAHNLRDTDASEHACATCDYSLTELQGDMRAPTFGHVNCGMFNFEPDAMEVCDEWARDLRRPPAAHTPFPSLTLDPDAETARAEFDTLFRFKSPDYAIERDEWRAKHFTEIEEDTTVGETILQQLGGRRFTVMTGAKNFVGGKNYLSFRIGRNSSQANAVRITLNGRDTYDVEFLRVPTKNLEGKVVEYKEDVYADQLRELFTRVTGLETSLGTMGRPPANEGADSLATLRMLFINNPSLFYTLDDIARLVAVSKSEALQLASRLVTQGTAQFKRGDGYSLAGKPNAIRLPARSVGKPTIIRGRTLNIQGYGESTDEEADPDFAVVRGEKGSLEYWTGTGWSEDPKEAKVFDTKEQSDAAAEEIQSDEADETTTSGIVSGLNRYPLGRARTPGRVGAIRDVHAPGADEFESDDVEEAFPKSAHYHVVSPAGVVVFSGNKAAAEAKRKKLGAGHFIGVSNTKKVGDEWKDQAYRDAVARDAEREKDAEESMGVGDTSVEVVKRDGTWYVVPPDGTRESSFPDRESAVAFATGLARRENYTIVVTLGESRTDAAAKALAEKVSDASVDVEWEDGQYVVKWPRGWDHFANGVEPFGQDLQAAHARAVEIARENQWFVTVWNAKPGDSPAPPVVNELVSIPESRLETLVLAAQALDLPPSTPVQLLAGHYTLTLPGDKAARVRELMGAAGHGV